jgi:hypothetical protein
LYQGIVIRDYCIFVFIFFNNYVHCLCDIMLETEKCVASLNIQPLSNI